MDDEVALRRPHKTERVDEQTIGVTIQMGGESHEKAYPICVR